MLTCIALSLFKTLDNIAIPCSVNAIGGYLSPPQLEVPKWLLKSANSSGDSSNIKSGGKRPREIQP